MPMVAAWLWERNANRGQLSVATSGPCCVGYSRFRGTRVYLCHRSILPFCLISALFSTSREGQCLHNSGTYRKYRTSCFVRNQSRDFLMPFPVLLVYVYADARLVETLAVS